MDTRIPVFGKIKHELKLGMVTQKDGIEGTWGSWGNIALTSSH